MNLVDCKTALKTLKSGLPVIFPTDTLPAIGCLPKFSKIIYEYKKRDRNKPLILMGSKYKQLMIKNKFTSIKIVKDLSGIGRFTIGRYK